MLEGRPPREPSADPPSTSGGNFEIGRRHLRFGWWSLLLFLSLGIGLEAMHGLKIGWYLNAGQETRRLMFTLAHAHGTLLALVNIVFGLTSQGVPSWRNCAFSSRGLLVGSWLLPLGFFFGGIYIYEGDPGVGVWLVPVGGLLLLLSVLSAAVGISRALDKMHGP